MYIKSKSKNDCVGLPKRIDMDDVFGLEHLQEDWGTQGHSGKEFGHPRFGKMFEIGAYK
ncbi:hypothetical protein KI387_031695, partial [Taxus chinensis]